MTLLLDDICTVSWWPIIILFIIPICYLLWKIERMVNFLKAMKGVNILTMTGVPVIFVAAFLVLDKACVVPNEKAVFKENFSDMPEADSCYVQRPDIIREIQYILRPQSTDFDDIHPIHPGGYFFS